MLKLKREALEAKLKNAKALEKPESKIAANKPMEIPTRPKEAITDPSKPETIEDRMARLKAQRDALLKKRKEDREKELESYNASQGGAQLDQAKNTFYKQMIKADQGIQKTNPEEQPSANSTQPKPSAQKVVT